MKEEIHKDREEGHRMTKRMNEVVKKIKPADSVKVALTVAPFSTKEKVLIK
jgi:hypothetical protein